MSFVRVSFSFATAPRSPARSSGTCVWVLPCSASRWPSRSGVSRVTLCTVVSDLNVPATTRSMVMRPANGSAMVFHTNAACGALSAGVTAVSAPSLAVAANGALGGEGT